MSDQWWYQAFGEEFGPVPFATIQEQYDAGTLSASDQVRRGAGGTWQRLAAVSPKFAENPPAATSSPATSKPSADPASAPKSSAGPTSAAEEPREHVSELSSAIRQATRDSVRKENARLGRSQTRKTTTRQMPRLSGGALQGVSASIIRLGELLAAPFVLLAGLIRDYWIAVVACLLLASILAAVVILPEYWWTNETIAAELADFHAEFGRLRDANASDQQWQEFTQRVLPVSQLMIERLEPTANSDRPVRLELLRASRDYLPDMLRNDREAPGESEEMFVEHLAQAERLSGGSSAASGDWLMPAIIVGDGVLLLLGGIWFFRRRS